MSSSQEAEQTRAALLQASSPPPKSLFHTLITANHILHHHSIVDAYGHISVRNPQNPSTFFLSRSLAPALVSSRSDIEEYHIDDARPVEDAQDVRGAGGGPNERKRGYAERFIHSEVYKKYRGVKCVVHAHSEPILPFAISSVPLKPVFHMAGVMGTQPPVYDITQHYKSADDLHSLLVVNTHLGAALAAGFMATPGSHSTLAKTTNLIKNYLTAGGVSSAAPDFPPSPVVLMRGHGFTCIGASIEEAVYRAIFTVANARIQTTALLMQGSFNLGLVADRFGADRGEGGNNPGPAKQESIKYLSEREAKDAWKANQGTAERPWALWCAEVKASRLYTNDLDFDDEVTGVGDIELGEDDDA